MKRIITTIALLATVLPAEAWFRGRAPGIVWERINLGSGGYMTGMNIALDGTRWTRTDISNAYVMPAGETTWRACVTRQSMPPGAYSNNGGIYEIVGAPSDSQVAYMIYGSGAGAVHNYLYKTTNQCQSWTLVADFPDDIRPFTISPIKRLAGGMIAVDPVNPNHAYFSHTVNGVYQTYDGGATLTLVAAIDPSQGANDLNPGHAGMAFEPVNSTGPDAGTTTCPVGGGTCTKTLVIPSYGTGVWRTTNAGASFTQIAFPPTPPRSIYDVVAEVSTDNSDNILVAVIWTHNSANANAVGVSDEAGLTWTLRKRCDIQTNPGGTTFRGEISVWWAHAPSPLSNNKVFGHFSGGDDAHELIVFAVSGVDTTTPFDPNASLTPCGNAAPVPTFSTTNSDVMVFTGTVFATTTPATTDSGFAVIYDNAIGNPAPLFVEYDIRGTAVSSESWGYTGTAYQGGLNDALVQCGGCTLALDPNASSKARGYNYYYDDIEPVISSQGTFACDGTYYTSLSPTGQGGQPFKYASGAWTQLAAHSLITSFGAWVVNPHPTDCDRLYISVGQRTELILQSLNGGVTYNASWNGATGFPVTLPQVSPTIGYLERLNGGAIFAGGSQWNPTVDATTGRHHMEASAGFCYWTFDFPSNNAAFNFNALCTGVESTVPNTVIAPPSGAPLFGVQDIGLFYNLNTSTFPDDVLPTGNLSSLAGCQSVDYSAGTPTFVAAACVQSLNHSGYSASGGAPGTWTLFPNWPAVGNGPVAANIAISTSDTDNMIAVMGATGVYSGQREAYYTKDAGATAWAPLRSCPGVPTSGAIGWGPIPGSYTERKSIIADKNIADTFYGYNYAVPGFFTITDSGDTCVLTRAGALPGGFQENGYMKLFSVPGFAGHIYAASGVLAGFAHPAATVLLRSTDGGANWSTCGGGVTEVWAMAIGYPAANPTIYIYGYVGSTLAIYKSTDNCTSWTYLDQYAGPTNSETWFQVPVTMAASMDEPVIYVGSGSGMGYVKGTVN